jgi:hypothetical protein
MLRKYLLFVVYLFFVSTTLLGCGGEENYTVIKEKTVTFDESGTTTRESTSQSFGN